MARTPDVLASSSGLRTRNLVEPDQMRAMAHPRRMDLIDLLSTEGPMTATQCAERLNDSAASCSYHLRQLARYGFVEEAPGGTGRQRPWRYVAIGNRITSDGTPARDAAADELMAVIDVRNQDKLRRFRHSERRDPWAAQGETTDFAFKVTEAELAELIAKVAAIYEPLQQRTFDDAAPADARFVDIVSLIMPRAGERDA